jgi:hypothetical protein
MIEWVTLQIVEELTGKPSRTLRHYAALGKFEVKKEGKHWMCNLESLVKSGIKINREKYNELFSAKKEQVPAANLVVPIKSPEKKKFKQLRDLGVYSELLGMAKAEEKYPAPIKIYFEEALKNLAIGFFEYSFLVKVEYFKRARRELVSALASAQLHGMESLSEKLETSILRGVSGLIRKLETRPKENHGRQ